MNVDMVLDMIWVYKLHLTKPNKFKIKILGSMGPPPWEDIIVPVAIQIWIWIWRLCKDGKT